MRLFFSIFSACVLSSLTTTRAADLPIGEFDTRYCGPQSLRPFNCTDFDPPRDQLIARICYNPQSDVMLIRLGKYGYCYCGLGPAKFKEFANSNEMGRYYNRELKGRFHCPNDTRSR